MPNTVRRPDDDRRRWEAQRRRQREEAERREQARTSRDRRQRTTQLERQSLMGPMDLPFLLLTLLLTGVGLVMVFSASFPSAYYETGDGTYYFKRQLIFAVLGLFAMVVMSRINYQRLRGASKLLLGFAVFLLVLVIVPKNPLAITNNNATRWLGTQSFSFQPSEIAKLAVVIYFADSISKKKRKMVSGGAGPDRHFDDAGASPVRHHPHRGDGHCHDDRGRHPALAGGRWPGRRGHRGGAVCAAGGKGHHSIR